MNIGSICLSRSTLARPGRARRIHGQRSGNALIRGGRAPLRAGRPMPGTRPVLEARTGSHPGMVHCRRRNRVRPDVVHGRLGAEPGGSRDLLELPTDDARGLAGTRGCGGRDRHRFGTHRSRVGSTVRTGPAPRFSDSGASASWRPVLDRGPMASLLGNEHDGGGGGLAGRAAPRQVLRRGAHAWWLHGSGWLVFHATTGPEVLLFLAPTALCLPWAVQRTGNPTVGLLLHAALNGPSSLALALGLI